MKFYKRQFSMRTHFYAISVDKKLGQVVEKHASGRFKVWQFEHPFKEGDWFAQEEITAVQFMVEYTEAAHQMHCFVMEEVGGFNIHEFMRAVTKP